MKQLLLEYQGMFATSDTDLGSYGGVKYRVETGEACPIQGTLRRTPLGFQGEEEGYLKKNVRLRGGVAL